MQRFAIAIALLLPAALLITPAAWAQGTAPAEATSAATQPAPPHTFDPALAARLGADERGMRGYVLVILKTGPTRVPDGPERQEMFRGHFANINRLAAEDKLAVAGPLDGVEGRRGLYIFFGSDIDAVRAYVNTDPVVQKGEMVAEYHKFYGSAALALVREVHERITKPAP